MLQKVLSLSEFNVDLRDDYGDVLSANQLGFPELHPILGGNDQGLALAGQNSDSGDLVGIIGSVVSKCIMREDLEPFPADMRLEGCGIPKTTDNGHSIERQFAGVSNVV